MNNSDLFIELGANLGTDKPKVRNIIEPYSEQVIEEFREKYGNIDVFASVFKYDDKEIRKAKQISPLYFDLDGEYALDDLKDLVGFLLEHKCPEQAIQVFYSGSKGFHLEVPFEALNIESDQQLNKIYEAIVKAIKSNSRLPSLDTGIYDNVRLWRLPNSINPKSGLYKIPLALEELTLTLDEIKELAKIPRPDFKFSDVVIWPDFKLQFQKVKRQILKVKRDGIFEPVGEGLRNDITFKRALKLKAEGKTFDEAVEICSGIEDEPQLSESEIKRTVASAYQDKYTGGKDGEEKTEPQALQAFKIAAESGAVFFHDQFNVGYLSPKGDGSQIFKIKSRACENWLTHLYWKSSQSVLNPTALNSIIQMLEARAIFEGPKHKLHTRIAEHNDAIWYDLGDGRAVKINSNSWEIVEDPPILFKRFPHQKPQVEPKPNGDIKELLDFVNLSFLEDGSLSPEQKLLLSWVVFSFVPDLPHPARILAGPQGSNKSTFQKVLKELIDPSSVQAQTTPNGVDDFIQTSSHHWFLVLDNVSHLSESLSDTICRVITGGGFSKRELYSDDSDVIYDFKHIIGINGINLVVEKADLLDRSLIFNLKRTNNFTTEKVFWSKFEERKQYILGGVFDVLVKTIRLLNKTPEPSEHFRMADFAHWGSVIVQSLGFDSSDFVEAYKANVSRQNEEAIDASPVGIALIEFMSSQEEWIGTATELLTELEKLAEKLHINIKSKIWPKDARWVWRRIVDILPNLESEKIRAFQNRDKQRFITLQKIKDEKPELLIERIESSDDISDDIDNILRGEDLGEGLPF